MRWPPSPARIATTASPGPGWPYPVPTDAAYRATRVRRNMRMLRHELTKRADSRVTRPVLPASRRLFGSLGKGAGPANRCARTAAAVPACGLARPATRRCRRSSRRAAARCIGMVGGKGRGQDACTSAVLCPRAVRTTVQPTVSGRYPADRDQQGGAGSPRQWLENASRTTVRARQLFQRTAESRSGLRPASSWSRRQPQRGLRFPKQDRN